MIPRVSVGMPVYNGENFGADAIQSILGQSFTDCELIISDNASTDGTEAMCRRFASADKRVRYYRNSENRGAAWNFNRVFELARGEYFKWAAHDDLMAPEYVSRCVAALDDASAEVVLCYPKTWLIDASGKRLGRYERQFDRGSPDPQRRFREVVCVPHGCFEVFGLMRASVLRQTRLIGHYVASDLVLLGELALRGVFLEVPSYLFFRRAHANTSLQANADEREVAAWFDPANRDRCVFAYGKVIWEHLKSVRQAPVSRRCKVRCYAMLLTRMPRRYWRHIGGDIKRELKRVIVA